MCISLLPSLFCRLWPCQQEPWHAFKCNLSCLSIKDPLESLYCSHNVLWNCSGASNWGQRSELAFFIIANCYRLTCQITFELRTRTASIWHVQQTRRLQIYLQYFSCSLSGEVMKHVWIRRPIWFCFYFCTATWYISVMFLVPLLSNWSSCTLFKEQRRDLWVSSNMDRETVGARTQQWLNGGGSHGARNLHWHLALVHNQVTLTACDWLVGLDWDCEC